MTYSDNTIDTLCVAWDNGLDYVTLAGVNFGMYPDGIWEINDSCILDDNAKVKFVYKPNSRWGCNAD